MCPPGKFHVFCLGLALVLAGFLPGCGRPTGTGSPGQHLVAATRAYDLGILMPGEQAVRTLSLRNTGRETLLIRHIRTSSHRLTVDVSSLAIPGGGTREVSYALRSEVWEEGPFREWILLYSNDRDVPLLKVRVQGGFDAPVTWSPKIPMVGFTRRDENRPIRLVHLSTRDRTPIGPVRVTSLVPYTRAEATLEGPGQYSINLILEPDAPLMPLFGWVTIETAHPKLPTLSLPVRGQLLGDLNPRPYQFDLGIVGEGTPASATITLVNGGSRQTRVLKVEPHLPVPARVSVTPQGKNFRITVQIPSAPGVWSLKGLVNIFTDHPEEPVVQVHVVGWVALKKPLERSATEGSDAGLFELLKAALFEDENELPSDEIVPKILRGVPSDRTVALLLRALTEDHFLIRQRAVEVLGMLKSRRAREQVRAAVTDDVNAEVRRTAAAALAQIDGREALPTLFLALQDDDDWVRGDAATVLGGLGDRRAIPALKAALKDESTEVRDTAARALQALEGGNPTPARPVPPATPPP